MANVIQMKLSIERLGFAEMPVMLTARQYQALDDALEILEERLASSEHDGTIDTRIDPELGKVHQLLCIAAICPWDNPANKPVLKRIGRCFKNTSI